MLIVTDKSAVDAAFASCTPRPFREVVLEVYPDAVEDANGRFHAPHDNYECPITGNLYRGGEYLPMEEIEDPMERAMRAPGSTVRYPEARDLAGNVHRWTDGTKAQQRAAWAELVRQTRAHDSENSRHVGEVGAMVELRNLRLEVLKSWEGYYGKTFLHVLKDPMGNVVVYKGSKRLRTGPNPYLDKDIQRGELVSLRCKVKAHDEREGVCQTLVERPKVIK